MAGKDFDAFKATIEEKFMGHPVVTSKDWVAAMRPPLRGRRFYLCTAHGATR